MLRRVIVGEESESEFRILCTLDQLDNQRILPFFQRQFFQMHIFRGPALRLLPAGQQLAVEPQPERIGYARSAD